MRPELEVALLRTAQEALVNVAKHAHANRVGVTLPRGLYGFVVFAPEPGFQHY